jgi:hypothetical protein
MTDGHDTDRPSPRDLQARIMAEREGIPFIYWCDSDGVQHILMLPIDGRRVTIGRRADQTVSLHWDSQVSRSHALLDPVGEHWTLEDEGSSNGSWVQGGRITGRHRLNDGETMCFGDTRVTFRDPIGAEGAPSTTRAPTGPAGMQIMGAKRKVLIALCRPLVDEASATPATNRSIAAELHTSEEAVKAHMRELFGTFGYAELPQNEKRARLAATVVASGMIAPHEF